MNNNPLLKKKIFLFVTEFLSGVAVMGVETAASRLLAPYFSSSQIVWTLIIGTILIAMSIGNFLGGRLSDKHPDVTILYVLMLIAGAYICLIPFVGRYIIALVSAMFALFVKSGLLIYASLTTCLILFVPPLMVLGMVTPSLIKYTMGNNETSGKIVGILEALNTLGSIIGTFIPTFLSIPTIGTNMTFALFGGLICLIALVYLFTGFIHDIHVRNNPEKFKEENSVRLKNIVKRGLLSFSLLAVSLAGVFLSVKARFVFWNDETLVKEDESMYNYLQVNEDDEAIYFSTNVMFGVQSMIKKDKSLTGMYYDYCLASTYMSSYDKKDKTDMLILGNGTGTFATLVDKYIPSQQNITGVEIDQKIIDLSHDLFMMPDSVNTVCDDGRAYIQRASEKDKKYDVIMVDAYSSVSVPFQMATVEFFTEVKSHLKEDGVMVMNINMYGKQEKSLDQALSNTVSSLFDEVYAMKVPNGSGDELFASDNPDMVKRLGESLSSITDSSLRNRMSYVYDNLEEHIDTGIRLYDDTADVEVRSMYALDDIISAELAYYQKIYKEKGFKGLLDYLLG